MDSRGSDGRHAGADIFSNAEGSAGSMPQMALIEATLNNRVIIHRRKVAIDVIEIEADTRSGTLHIFFGCTLADVHYSAAILLRFTTPRIKNAPNIIDASNTGYGSKITD
jgi:hypothetical protein